MRFEGWQRCPKDPLERARDKKLVAALNARFEGYPRQSRHPIERAREKKLIASLNAMKTLRVVGGAIYADASDFVKPMRALHAKTRHLVKR